MWSGRIVVDVYWLIIAMIIEARCVMRWSYGWVLAVVLALGAAAAAGHQATQAAAPVREPLGDDELLAPVTYTLPVARGAFFVSTALYTNTLQQRFALTVTGRNAGAVLSYMRDLRVSLTVPNRAIVITPIRSDPLPRTAFPTPVPGQPSIPTPHRPHRPHRTPEPPPASTDPPPAASPTRGTLPSPTPTRALPSPTPTSPSTLPPTPRPRSLWAFPPGIANEVLAGEAHNLVIEIELQPFQAASYAQGYDVQFVIDPVIGQNVVHDYRQRCNTSVVAGVETRRGVVLGTLFQNNVANQPARVRVPAGSKTTLPQTAQGYSTFDLLIQGVNGGTTDANQYRTSGSWSTSYYSPPPSGGGC